MHISENKCVVVVVTSSITLQIYCYIIILSKSVVVVVNSSITQHIYFYTVRLSKTVVVVVTSDITLDIYLYNIKPTIQHHISEINDMALEGVFQLTMCS